MKHIQRWYTFDDLDVGDEFVSATHTVSETDITQFAGLTGDFNELPTSRVFAATTRFGERIAHGLLILSLANGLYVRLNLFETSVFLGIDEWKSTKPVFIGDTIHLRLTISEKRLSRDGGRGIFGMKYEVLNQNDELVAVGLFHRMLSVSK